MTLTSRFLPALLLAASILAGSASPGPDEKAAYARWMASAMDWGFLSTTSTRSKGTMVGAPFGNPYSFASVKGVPYFYMSDLDASAIDLFTAPKASARGTFTTSDATLLAPNGSAAIRSCEIGAGLGDPENPPCARLTLSGVFSKVAAGSAEEASAKAALFAQHPSFKHYPKDHGFYVAKLLIDGIWLINMYGGAAIIDPTAYFNASEAVEAVPGHAMRRQAASKPPFWNKAGTARWMTRQLDWGVLSTRSTRSEGTHVGDAFGNPYSFADVDGVVYFYASGLDSSMIDLFSGDNASTQASFTLSEASLPSSPLRNRACHIGSSLGDPENPPCARLQLYGRMSKMLDASPETAAAKTALFARHPSFKDYPTSHDFYVAKLAIEGVWLIDIFGGAAIISPADYFKASQRDSDIVLM